MLFDTFKFFFSFSMRDPSKPGFKEYAAKYAFNYEDPKVIHHAKISTIAMFNRQHEFARAHKTSTPFLVINASADTVVRNSASAAMVARGGAQSSGPGNLNKLVEIIGADHLTITAELEYFKQNLSHTLEFFDSLVAGDSDS
jgi:alpha-beta hydrolase superfamily lysophospholipase